MAVLLKLPTKPAPKLHDEQQQPPTPEQVPTKEGAAKLRQFLDSKAPYEHPYRMRKQRLWSKADHYDKGNQWLVPSHNVDPARTQHWSPREFKRDDPNYIPTPSFNQIHPRLRNEAARLGRPEYKPYVYPTGENPTAKAKEEAEFSAEILQGSLDAMSWGSRVAEPFFLHMPLYGGGWLKSYMDYSMEETTRLPKEKAMKCPAEGCDFKVADPSLNVDEYAAVNQEFPDQVTVTKNEADEQSYSIGSCLTCKDHEEKTTVDQPAMDEMGQPMMGPDGAMIMTPVTQSVRMPGPPKLEPFSPVDQELKEQDSFGRELGEDVMMGEWLCETCSPYDMFVDNLGVDVDPALWEEIEQVHVRSLDWGRKHFPDKAADLRPENSEALLKWHPIAGERAIFYGSTDATGLFRRHSRVKEYHKKPYLAWDPDSGVFRLNLGRSIMMMGDVVLLDGPFMLRSKTNPDVLIPRVHYEYVPWEFRSGGREMDGLSLSELLFDAQDSYNECKSQTQDTRQRGASPKQRVTRGMNFNYENLGGAGAHYVWDPDPTYPDKEPVEVGSTTIDAGVDKEMERDKQFMDDAAGSQDVEFGKVPTNVSSGTMLQMTAEQAGERRKPRIRRIREAFERLWSHGLVLMHEFVREPRTLRISGELDEWTERTWTGADIAGQTTVKIKAEPEHDSPLQVRENVRDAVSLKVLDPTSSQKTRNMLAKKLNVHADLTRDDDIQYDDAEREFWDYVDQNAIPVVDDEIEDHEAHQQQHGLDCLSDKWKSLEKEAGWHEALLELSGWDKPDPMGPIDPMTGVQMPGLAPWQKIEQKFGLKWPRATEVRIFEAWKILLQISGQFQPKNPQALLRVMRFRAHLSAHRMLLEQRAAEANMGAQVAAAPDAAATAAGTMPTAAQPAMVA